MTMTLSGDGTITGLVAGGLPNATVTADDLAAGAALNSVSDGVFFRNRIINGDMRIDQRNNGASIAYVNNTHSVDRFESIKSSSAVGTAQRSTIAPAKFTNSLLITCTTGSSPTAAQLNLLWHNIEGFNTADLGWGTASAQTITLSFWVRSSLTGTFAGALTNADYNRGYTFTYTISSADTWEYKTVTISGDTTGTWGTGNGVGIKVTFDLGSGTDSQGTAGSWSGTLKYTTSGAQQIMASTGATFYITGVQLEVGSVATPFERRPYGTELMLCQRYYQTLAAEGITFNRMAAGYPTTALGASNFQVPMRATPSVTNSSMSGKNFYGLATDTNLATGAISISVNFGSPSGMLFYGNAATSLGGTAATPMVVNSAGATVNLSAEL